VTDPREYDYPAASRFCDIVMKGGITSGVVYPHAVCELARNYRFKNIGGTSAGAIAAAATAAAERGRAHGGFNELAALPTWLGSGKNLERLFQPQKSTRGLYRILRAAVGRRPLGPLWPLLVAVRSYPVATLLGMTPGVALALLATLEGEGLLRACAIAAGAIIALGGGALALAWRVIRRMLRAIPDNGYGLCSGWAEPEPGKPKPLTTWLHGQLLAYCGPLDHDGPLTFGDLWAGPDRAAPPEDVSERFVRLEMMTTNVTNRRGTRLPWDTRGWFFDPREFRRLFPEDVVGWMEEHPAPEQDQTVRRQRSRMMRALVGDLRPLPAAADLPVIVATRMSLSFPVLLSAIPLWRIDLSLDANKIFDEWVKWARAQGADWNPLAVPPDQWPEGQPATRPRAEQCWFSDGGIASNFPVHFFDRFVPRWPTFGINLRPFPPDRQPDDTDQRENTWMVSDNAGGILDWWHRAPSRPGRLWLKDGRLASFLAGIVRTMQNRVDEAQVRAPGYRDRIAHINHTDREGGLNLTMPPEVVAALTARGQAAAGRLVEAYTRDAGAAVISWDNHRWVRLRSTLAVLEDVHERVARGYGDPPAGPGERTYAELLGRGPEDAPASYRMSVAMTELARRQIEAITAAADAVRDGGISLTTGAPGPAPEARIAPRD
jgi:predicted acylesterase/phospholipase RssA